MFQFFSSAKLPANNHSIQALACKGIFQDFRYKNCQARFTIYCLRPSEWFSMT